ncbi:MAG: class I SAM-dependent methyltransferase, partial [Bacteroidales bacterium]|nr:class I SAM-dependent methyltransferase [Bacteroidales bacterium]
MTNKNNGGTKVDNGNATVGNGNITMGKGNVTVDKDNATADKGIPKGNKDYPLKEFYQKIYGRYDLVNRIFTFGQDRNWRKKAVEECLGNAPLQVLDICTGTGDLVLEMAEVNGNIQFTGYDFSTEMLEKAKEKAAA